MQTAPAPTNLPTGFTAPAGAQINQGKGTFTVPDSNTVSSPNPNAIIKNPTPTVVTSAPAATAVSDAQSKLGAALAAKNAALVPPTPPAPPTPPSPNGSNGVNTVPANSNAGTGTNGQGQSNAAANAPGKTYGTATMPTTPQGTMPANPTDGQVANDVNGTSWTWSATNGAWAPTASASGTSTDTTGGSSTSSTPLIPGTNIPSTGNAGTDALLKQYSDSITAFNGDIATINSQLDTMRAQMDAANQDLLTQIGASFDAQVSAAQSVNDAQVAGMTQSGIRSGLSRYAPDIYTGNITNIMQEGISKISDILNKKAQALAKAQAANEKEDYTTLYQEMQNYEKMQTQEQTQTLNLLKQVQSNQKLVDAETKQQLADAATTQKMQTTEINDHAYAILAALDDEAGVKGTSTLAQDQAMVQEYASLYGLDPQKLLAEVEQLKTTKDSYGSGIIGQYRFYSDFETQQGRTPLSFTDWQAQTAATKGKGAATANAELPSKEQLKETPTAAQANKNGSGTSVEDYASAVGLPLTVVTSAGAFSKWALKKVVAAGVPVDIANGIWANIAAGNDLNTIRQGLAGQYGQGTGFGYLDKFMSTLQG